MLQIPIDEAKPVIRDQSLEEDILITKYEVLYLIIFLLNNPKNELATIHLHIFF